MIRPMIRPLFFLRVWFYRMLIRVLLLRLVEKRWTTKRRNFRLQPASALPLRQVVDDVALLDIQFLSLRCVL